MRVHPKNKLYVREIKMYFYLAKVGYIYILTAKDGGRTLFV